MTKIARGVSSASRRCGIVVCQINTCLCGGSDSGMFDAPDRNAVVTATPRKIAPIAEHTQIDGTRDKDV